MAKKQVVSKTQAVRDFLKLHPGTGNTEIAKTLSKKGIKLTPAHVANIKANLKAKRLARKAAAAKPAVTASPAPVAAIPEAPAKPANAVTLEQIKTVGAMVKTIGGFHRLHDMLGVIKEVGGLKKFKDLLEALSVTDAGPTGS